MPNWVCNNVLLKGKDVEKLMEYIHGGEDDYGNEVYIDFNKIVPMPKELNIISGSDVHRLVAYNHVEIVKIMFELDPHNELSYTDRLVRSIYEYNSNHDDLFKLHVTHHDGRYNFSTIETKLIKEFRWILELSKQTLSDNDKYHVKALGLDEERFKDALSFYWHMANLSKDNIIKYGHSDWYDWRCSNWGTKWGACESQRTEDENNEVVLYFNTAWSYPHGIYQALCEYIFKNDLDVTMEVHYADEDMGQNTGYIYFDPKEWGGVLSVEYDTDRCHEALKNYVMAWGMTEEIKVDEAGRYYVYYEEEDDDDEDEQNT